MRAFAVSGGGVYKRLGLFCELRNRRGKGRRLDRRREAGSDKAECGAGEPEEKIFHGGSGVVTRCMAVDEKDIHPSVSGVVSGLIAGQGIDAGIVVVVLQPGADVAVIRNICCGAQLGLAGAAKDFAVGQVALAIQQVEIRPVAGVVREVAIEFARVHQ